MKEPCFFIQEPVPKIDIIYIYPHNGFHGFSMKALAFVQSYERNPPGLRHGTIIVSNGGPMTDSSKDLFAPIPNKTYLERDNSGWDLGGFQDAARASTADMLVFFGSHAYFRKPGWLHRMYEVALELGDTLYGASGNQGDQQFNVFAHVRTTGFWCSRLLFNAYPIQVTQGGQGGQRYEMEHGKEGLTSWIIRQGKQPWVVGWDAVFPVQQSDSMPGGYRNGDQYNLLAGDRLTCPPYYPHP